MSEEQFSRIRQEVEECPQLKVVLPSDLLTLPEDLASVLRRAFRAGTITLAELADGFGLEPAQAEVVAKHLIQKGFLHRKRVPGAKVYSARFGGRANQPKRGLLKKLF
jgi:DNA-binding MarR family transcriptional regulator